MAKNDGINRSLDELNTMYRVVEALENKLSGLPGKFKAVGASEIKLDKVKKELQTLHGTFEMIHTDFDKVSKSISSINTKKIEPKLQADKLGDAVKGIKDEFDNASDAVEAFNTVLDNFSPKAIEKKLENLSKTAKETESNLAGISASTGNAGAAGGSEKLSSGSGQSTLNKVLQNDTVKFLAAENAKILLEATSEAVSVRVNSSLGAETGTMVNSVMSSAMSGALAGAAAGIPGIVAGAVIGTVSGFIIGSTKIFEKEDEAFKDYYKNQYEKLLEEQGQMLSQGTEIYASREQSTLPFSALLGGKVEAQYFLDEINDFAIHSTYNPDELEVISKSLLNTGYDSNKIISLLEKVGEAGAALDWSSEDAASVAVAMGSMEKSDKATLDSLNSLIQRNIPVWEALSEIGSEQTIIEKVNNGEISGRDVTKYIVEYISSHYSGSMEAQMQTYSGLSQTLEELKNNLSAAQGEGYAEKRKSGIEDEIEFLDSEKGDQLKDAYKKMGEWSAHLENLGDEYERDALKAVMTGEISNKFDEKTRKRLQVLHEEYSAYEKLGTEDAGAKMGGVLMEGEAIGKNGYNASGEAQQQLDINRTLAENIKNDAGIKEEYWNAGYEMGVQFSYGLDSARVALNRKNYGIQHVGNQITNNRTNAFGSYDTGTYHTTPSDIRLPVGGKATQFASGISYVPYDNFPAILYGGEHVLATQDNRSYEKSGTGTLNITGNNFYIREEADIEKVAKMMASKYLQSMALAQ